MTISNQNILIVDDDRGFLDLMTEVFKSYPYQIKCVNNPVDAVKEAKKAEYRVILLDFQLPTINGDELIAALQQVNPQARFIILSGMGSEEIEAKFKGLGYFAFFEKGSMNVSKLRSTIVAALEH